MASSPVEEKEKKKEPLVAILGPTASGKSACALALAQRFKGEIISGDSAAVYIGMDIGTAKPTEEERKAVPHHLVDILEPVAGYNVSDFKEQAAACITDIVARGRLPILAGGTGLYARALLEDYAFSQAGAEPALRKKLEEEAKREGAAALYEKLQATDPQAAALIHPNNVRRTVRALEAALSGVPVRQQRARVLAYDALVMGLKLPRELLYERIDARVDAMLAAGLEAEVAALLKKGVPRDCQAMQAIGYRQMAAYLDGSLSYAEMVSKVKQATRNFAKRQLTWYKKMPYIKWWCVKEGSAAEYDEIIESMSEKIAGMSASFVEINTGESQ